MLNEFEIRGDTTAIFIDSREFGQVECLIDTSDLPRAREIEGRWGVQLNSNNKYYLRGYHKGEEVTFSRFVLNIKEPCKFRYVDKNAFNNKRSNIKIIDRRKILQL